MPVDVAEHITHFDSHEAPASRSRRAVSLDAVRGLAILGMVLSGMVPYFHDTLPAWMYHAQVPPPMHVYDAAISGLTWVDAVFPLFLFALGAAVPLALGTRLERGNSKWGISFGILWRGILLLFFALYKQHLEPSALTETYGDTAWLLGPLAFIILFPILLRLPPRWPWAARFCVRLTGWVAAVVLLSLVHYPDGGFSVFRHDIIIVILANVAVSTSLLWLVLQGRLAGRIGIMLLIVLLLAARRYTSWGMAATELNIIKSAVGDQVFESVAWACHPMYQQYLLITIPGTIAGDILASWLRPASHRLSFSIQNSRWGELSMVRCLVLAFLSFGIVGSAVVGLYQHLTGWTSGLVTMLAVGGFLVLYSPPVRSRISSSNALRGQPKVSALMFRSLFAWGVAWLMIGLAVLPYDGGIRKDPASLSYMMICSGLAIFVLIGMAIISEAFHRPGLLSVLVANGQNPMVAYVAGGMIVLPILHLLPAPGGSALHWLSEIGKGPWAGFTRGLGYTLITAGFVWSLTKLRLIWRT